MDKGKTIMNLHWIGRLGNRLFQYAFMMDYANKHPNCTVYLPSEWEGDSLFVKPPNCKIIPDD